MGEGWSGEGMAEEETGVGKIRKKIVPFQALAHVHHLSEG